MKNDNTSTSGQQRTVPNVPSYPHASHICARHGSSFTGNGERKIYARNTYFTTDSEEKVQQYYSQQFGQPVQTEGGSSWRQETSSGNQHIVVQLTVESSQAGQAEAQTLIKSYCVVTMNTPQAS
ncbi:MAG: hypothetical protein HZT40_20280 [Candidatus Thiothrix singaporensis]|uniref:Uncharacterized protein n=1 Tax=Candidatus Thiothrix singaporensis TaxID=2799669 RepID=A0A7L6AWH2_9GAMM|nr:MAG: hypothetical protein HZT40_20280 [Candidatus Thiothrix singaporensis]